MEIVRGCP